MCVQILSPTNNIQSQAFWVETTQIRPEFWCGGWDLNPTLSGDVSRNFPLFLFSTQGYGTLIALGLEE
jgi:hypothetical protein